MIIVQIKGGLGNQLFQYAYARSLKEKGYDVLIDTYTWFVCEGGDLAYEVIKYNMLGPCSLRRFNISLSEYSLPGSACIIFKYKYFGRVARLLFRFWRKIISRLLKIEYYNFCLTWSFSNECCKFTDDGMKYVMGSFQSAKYFFDIREIILEEIRLKDETGLVEAEKKYLGNDSNTVSVHVRMDDYIELGRELDLDYYKKAFAYIEEKIKNITYCFFSNDIEFCKANFDLTNKKYIFIEPNQKEPYNDMILMSRCRHNIVSNSTFAWWGAWLNKNPDKIVIAPKVWIKVFPELDPVPDNWVKL